MYKKGNIPWNKNKKDVMPTPWNRGKHFSEDVRRKISQSRLNGNINPNIFKIDKDIIHIVVKRKGIEYNSIADADMFKKLVKYHWMLNSDGYIYTWILDFKNRKRNQLFMHHLVIGKKVGFEVDHINRNIRDNRKSNLRHLKRNKNLWNKSIYKNNTSGNSGIYVKDGKYIARIQANRKRIFLGVFDNKASAIDAYDEAKKIYHLI